MNRSYRCSTLQKNFKTRCVLKVSSTNTMWGDELSRDLTQPFNLGEIIYKNNQPAELKMHWEKNKPLFTSRVLTSVKGQGTISWNDFN